MIMYFWREFGDRYKPYGYSTDQAFELFRILTPYKSTEGYIYPIGGHMATSVGEGFVGKNPGGYLPDYCILTLKDGVLKFDESSISAKNKLLVDIDYHVVTWGSIPDEIV